MRDILKIDRSDNVATCLRPLAKGEEVASGEERVLIRSDIPVFHKVALRGIKKGGPVIKYGQVIGLATDDIARGDHVHIHNVESLRGRGDKGE